MEEMLALLSHVPQTKQGVMASNTALSLEGSEFDFRPEN
jgi:hypothetical protein